MNKKFFKKIKKILILCIVVTCIVYVLYMFNYEQDIFKWINIDYSKISEMNIARNNEKELLITNDEEIDKFLKFIKHYKFKKLYYQEFMLKYTNMYVTMEKNIIGVPPSDVFMIIFKVDNPDIVVYIVLRKRTVVYVDVTSFKNNKIIELRRQLRSDNEYIDFDFLNKFYDYNFNN